MDMSQRVKFSRHISLATLLLSIVALTGCKDTNTASVHGNVSLDGKPLEYGSITFTPEKGPAFGAVITDGAYKADQKGVAGKATVVVVAMPKPNSNATAEEIRAGGGEGDAVEQIPIDHPKQGQSVDIKAGDSQINFEF